MNRWNARSRTLFASAVAGVAIACGISAKATEPCTRDQICGLKNAEDFVRIPDTRWAIASRLAKDPTGGFSLVDLDQRTARVLMPDVSGHAVAPYADCPGAPVASALITHGLDIRKRPDGAIELFAVNHKSRQSIEIFDVRMGNRDPELIWKGCVILPSDVEANAVTSLPDGLAVTSFGSAGPQGDADFMAGHPAGFVDRWTSGEGWNRVAGSDFGGDNGVTAPSDGSALYINDWNDGTLRVLSLRDGRDPITIKLGDFHPDNLHLLPDGNLLIAGQVGKASDVIGCSGSGPCAVGSEIVVLDPSTRKIRRRWIVAPTPAFAAASTALLYGSDYWLSSYRGDRVVRIGPAPAAEP